MLRTPLFLVVALLTALPGQAATKFDPGQGWKNLLADKDLSGWSPMNSEKPFHWSLAAEAVPDPADPAKLKIKPLASGAEDGVLVNGPEGKAVNTVSEGLHGDVELYLEFMVPKGSNSGVYLQGLYEIQVLDSYGKPDAELKSGDCGGIYARYVNQQTVGGAPPRVNASRAPGEWQNFHIWFRAPRFDAAGKKTENARFVKVVHNGVAIHENVEVDGPTRAHMPREESPTGPLMLQGDHGPVAYRNIHLRPLR